MATLKCAIYCRLSCDDGTIDDSSSIQTQKDALSKYALQNGYEIFKIYVDDGISGTHDQRPGFQSMLRDAELGLFQILLTKDLSRLARNYLQAGYYMEEFFPKHHIRYIAVNDNYDSFKDDNEFAPFKNIINEWYAKDISKKVRYALANKRKAGIITTGTTPLFGYAYDNEKRRVIDPEAASIVKFIFEEYIKVQSSLQLKRILKEKKIYTPAYYFYIKYGVNKNKYQNCSEEEKYNWNNHRVSAILRNSEYTGDLILAKTHIDKIGSKHEVKTEKENLVIHKKKFEPIISDDLFNDVQRIMDGNKTQRLPIEVNKYKSLLLCPYCYQPLKYRQCRGYQVYTCRNIHCGQRTMTRMSIVDEAISNEIKLLKKVILNDKDKFINYAKDYSKKYQRSNTVDYKKISELKKRNAQIDQFIEKLIEGNISGSIPDSTYNTMLQKYKREHDDNDLKLKSLTDIKPNVDYTYYLDKFIESVERINPDVFDYEIFNALVTNIEIKVDKISQLKRNYHFKFFYRINGKMLEDYINEFKTIKQ